MPDKAMSLQDHFLNTLRRTKTPVTLFLMKGVKLQGVITWFDNFSLLLRREGQTQLVYKHSISTIVPLGSPEGLVPAADMADGRKAPQLQDLFLAAAARDGAGMTVYLVNGVMLQGHLAGFDPFSLALERGGQVQLVYKHAVSTLQPDQHLDLQGRDADEEGEGA